MPSNATSDAPAVLAGGAGTTGGLLDRLGTGLVIDLDAPARTVEDDLEDRILRATLRCLARWGTAKTTLDDVAKEAGCSRATVYRTVPGGKDAVFLAAGERELLRVLSSLAATAHQAPTLADLLTGVLSEGVQAIREHKVLRYLCEHEKGVILPYISFDGIDPLLALVRACLAPALERFLDPPTAAVTAEWLARLGISYGFDGDDNTIFLGDPEQARRFVSTFLLPALHAN